MRNCKPLLTGKGRIIGAAVSSNLSRIPDFFDAADHVYRLDRI